MCLSMGFRINEKFLHSDFTASVSSFCSCRQGTERMSKIHPTPPLLKVYSYVIFVCTRDIPSPFVYDVKCLQSKGKRMWMNICPSPVSASEIIPLFSVLHRRYPSLTFSQTLGRQSGSTYEYRTMLFFSNIRCHPPPVPFIHLSFVARTFRLNKNYVLGAT